MVLRCIHGAWYMLVVPWGVFLQAKWVQGGINYALFFSLFCGVSFPMQALFSSQVRKERLKVI